MHIGTAKPNTEERAQAPHHLIDHVSIHESYSVGRYVDDALACLKTIYESGDIAIVVGGTGLYLRALIEGIDDFPNVADTDKAYYVKLHAENGLSPLQSELEATDPEYYKSIDTENPHRLIRALSVIKSSGKKFSSFLGKTNTTRGFTPILIALDMPRDILYQRINQRVDQMMQQGLLEEVKSLHAHQELKSLNTVGYKELFQFLDNEMTLEHAVEKIKQHTRNYAKRQITWFKNKQNYKRFHPEQISDIKEYIDTLKEDDDKL